jgi:tetratricopeptide (TPR) repeat protein
LGEVFPEVVAFKDRDLILLGSRKPINLSAERLSRLYRDVEIATSLERAGMKYPSDVLVSLSLDRRGAEAFSSGAPLNTDDNMRLELNAPRTLYRDDVESILAAMREHPPDVLEHLVDVSSEAELLVEIGASFFTSGNLPAALEHAERSVALEPTFEGQKLLGQVLQRLGRTEEARNALEGALAAGGDPSGRRFVEAMLRSLNSDTGP